MKYYAINELNHLSENELLYLLKDSLGYEINKPIEVFAELSASRTRYDNDMYVLKNIKNIKNNQNIEYPLNDLEENLQIKVCGIHVPNTLNNKLKEFVKKHEKVFVTTNLVLAEIGNRKISKNPLLLKSDIKSLEIIHQFKPHNIEYKNGKLLLKNSFINFLENEYKEELISIKNSLEEKIQKEDIKYEQKKQTIQNKIEFIDKKLIDVENETELKIQNLNEKIEEKENELKKLDENRKLIINEVEKKNKEKQSLSLLIEELKVEIERVEKAMAKKLEKFRSFIKDKAEQLLKLEFIDEEEYYDLLMIKKEESKVNEKTISFKDDLSSDYQKAISHIHSYLFKQDIIYPRYILEDFMALIQTNDLIILAGESGSGKTNLVKSFAKAIGGKSFIIPVKPNWTSAEDLLGYYNPLEKKYLSTPFLEALLEAKNNPEVPYFICLDEMNLARVEYYFADFLSLLEERDSEPEIQLYSDSESSHVLSEFKNVLELINSTKEKYQKNNLVDYVSILKDKEVNSELKRVFGFSDKDSLIKYHTDLRKMISGLINIPSSIKFPKNVRIIGAINIDETTHYLSPKILDRAHIMKFDSPLLYDWMAISNEIEENDKKNYILKFELNELGVRKSYPSFDKDDEFCKTIVGFTKKYFSPMGVEVGLRTIRQGLNYQKIFIEQKSDERVVINNFILHKILPKLTFDGKKEITLENVKKEKVGVLSDFMNDLKNYIDIESIQSESNNAIRELENIINNAENNNDILNYWA